VYPLLGKLMIGLTGFFLLLALAARALSNTQPPNPALGGFVEGCEHQPQPCWYGIVPDVSTLEDAYHWLLKNNFVLLSDGHSCSKLDNPICGVDMLAASHNRQLVGGLVLQPCSTIKVGEAYLFMSGYITWITKYCDEFSMGTANHQWGLMFNDIKPHAFVKHFFLSGSVDPRSYLPHNWAGFLPSWKYNFEECLG
jgi:hypothetical protein